eukprot:m.9929 g.9929  ORF g.9929 m.9929 type:complete len:199 (+) comp3035_c0_seq2:2551-3147(+)
MLRAAAVVLLLATFARCAETLHSDPPQPRLPSQFSAGFFEYFQPAGGDAMLMEGRIYSDYVHNMSRYDVTGNGLIITVFQKGSALEGSAVTFTDGQLLCKKQPQPPAFPLPLLQGKLRYNGTTTIDSIPCDSWLFSVTMPDFSTEGAIFMRAGSSDIVATKQRLTGKPFDFELYLQFWDVSYSVPPPSFFQKPAICDE